MADTEANPIYEPRKFYQEQLRQQYHEAAESYFDKLLASTDVDASANAEHVKAYRDLLAKLAEAKKRQSHAGALKILLIVVGFLCLFAGVILIFQYSRHWAFIVGGIAVIAGGIVSLVFAFTNFKKKEDAFKKEVEALQLQTDAMLKTCYADLASLNEAYDWNAPVKIMKEVTPILNLDPYFSAERFGYLVEKFGFPKQFDSHTSTLGVLSGQIAGNPFVLERDLNEEYRDKTYTGSLTIYWTTTRSTKDGVVTEHHSQVLTAQATHKAPFYSTNTRLIYGNEAAPSLHFSRRPIVQNTDEKSVKRLVDKRVRLMDKKAKKDLQDGDSSSNFTKMNNEKFDALWGAMDRDNEVEFRLLYSPLAQKNVLDILTNPDPFGDDFVYVKDGKLNSVASAHSQNFDYSGDPKIFLDFDLEAAKAHFVSYCDAFIQNLYFDLAPIISVPLYQTHSPEEYIYGNFLSTNFTPYEQEVMANGLDPKSLRPDGADSRLPLILKIHKGERQGQSDVVQVKAYSYHTSDQVDYVPVFGGDGYWHDVPVPWVKYDYVECDTPMGVAEIGGTAQSYGEKLNAGIRELIGGGAAHYERGLLAFVASYRELAASGDFSTKLKRLFANAKK